MSSIIPSGAGSGDGGLSELPTLLKRWMTIQDEMATFNAELKQRRTQGKALKEVILRIMQTNKVAALNVSKGTVIHKVRESTEALTDSTLLKHCKEFFGGDEAQAKALVDYLSEHRGTTVRHDLKLQMPKADDDRLSHRS